MTPSYDEVFGRYVQAGPVRIHHGDIGDGAPLVLLHGTGPGSNAWNNFRLNIGPLARHFRVLPMDLPRFGRSERVALPGPRLDVSPECCATFSTRWAWSGHTSWATRWAPRSRSSSPSTRRSAWEDSRWWLRRHWPPACSPRCRPRWCG